MPDAGTGCLFRRHSAPKDFKREIEPLREIFRGAQGPDHVRSEDAMLKHACKFYWSEISAQFPQILPALHDQCNVLSSTFQHTPEETRQTVVCHRYADQATQQ